ncbi:MAG: thymidylate synthase [Nitrososphaeraceae archaeon]|nr:thymidylate synthase [Nitrososphaeraceae archaeon]
MVKRILEKPDYFQEVCFDGSGKGKNINKKSRWHLRNVHVMFENPSEFTGYNVKCKERSRVMNDYMEKERELFDRGEISSDKMGEISKIWKLIENPDKTINANYGFMCHHLRDAGNEKFGNKFMTQFEWCQDRLKRNIHTLQAIMHFNRPKDQFIENLDQPCTVFCQFTVENGALNFHGFMRSNDIIYGTPYNLAYFKLLQGRMLNYLNNECGHNLKYGYLHHNVTSLHLYFNKLDIAKSIVGMKH